MLEGFQQRLAPLIADRQISSLNGLERGRGGPIGTPLT